MPCPVKPCDQTSGARMYVMPGSTDPVSHLVFSDGLASVSVFVEIQTKTKESTGSDQEESVTHNSKSGQQY